MPCVRSFLAVLVGAGLLLGCRDSEQPEAVQDGATQPELPSLPVAEPQLDRRALLFAVADVASLFAAGRDDADLQRDLEGRRFEIHLRFGCSDGDGDSRSWIFDENERVLRVRAAREISLDDPIIRRVFGAEAESVEGFWIRRPWLLEAACPIAPARPTALASKDTGDQESQPAADEDGPSSRIGIVQFFTEQDSRAHRRNERPYSATVRLDEGEEPSGKGYDLVLSGRLASLPDGRVIACRGAEPDRAPTCIASAKFDRISLATPDGETIAEWSTG